VRIDSRRWARINRQNAFSNSNTTRQHQYQSPTGASFHPIKTKFSVPHMRVEQKVSTVALPRSSKCILKTNAVHKGPPRLKKRMRSATAIALFQPLIARNKNLISHTVPRMRQSIPTAQNRFLQVQPIILRHLQNRPQTFVCSASQSGISFREGEQIAYSRR